MEGLPCSQGTQQSRWRACRWKEKGSGAPWGAHECLLVLRDPVGGTTWLQIPAAALLDALDHSSGKEDMHQAPVSQCSGWTVCLALSVPEGMKQKHTISTGSKHRCFQLQQPLIQLLASTQAAAVTYLPLQWVRRGWYEESGVVIFLDRKGLENKGLCIR